MGLKLYSLGIIQEGEWVSVKDLHILFKGFVEYGDCLWSDNAGLGFVVLTKEGVIDLVGDLESIEYKGDDEVVESLKVAKYILDMFNRENIGVDQRDLGLDLDIRFERSLEDRVVLFYEYR